MRKVTVGTTVKRKYLALGSKTILKMTMRSMMMATMVP
jgi:hypothetical protein